MRLLLLISFFIYCSLMASEISYQCVSSVFNETVYDNGLFFGQLKSKLIIEKKGCSLLITQKRLLEDHWNIDVCREPIHIKYSSWGKMSIMKRSESCSVEKKSSDYCDSYYRLLSFIEDNGLIFAQGDRQDLASPHGQIYCVYSLLRRYLNDGDLFSSQAPLSNVNMLSEEGKDIQTQKQ